MLIQAKHSEFTVLTHIIVLHKILTDLCFTDEEKQDLGAAEVAVEMGHRQLMEQMALR